MDSVQYSARALHISTWIGSTPLIEDGHLWPIFIYFKVVAGLPVVLREFLTLFDAYVKKANVIDISTMNPERFEL